MRRRPPPVAGLSQWLVLGFMLTAVVASFWYLALDLSGLFSPEGIEQIGRFVGGFFPPELSAGFLRQVESGRPAQVSTAWTIEVLFG